MYPCSVLLPYDYRIKYHLSEMFIHFVLYHVIEINFLKWQLTHNNYRNNLRHSPSHPISENNFGILADKEEDRSYQS